MDTDKDVELQMVENVELDLSTKNQGQLNAAAEVSEQQEHSYTLWESLRVHKKAVLWAAGCSLCIIMEGYDTALLGNFWALPAFAERYGVYVPSTGSYTVEARWQSAVGQASTIGNIFGIFWGSFLIDRLGYRKTLLINMAFMIPFIAIVFSAPNLTALLIGELLCGVPWGVFSTLAEAYASELCPLTLRGYLTTYVNLCWVIGQFIASGVVLGLENNTTSLAYRLPFAIQWIWPIPLMIIFWFMPESPWWLVRHGRLEEAEKSVRRVSDEKTAKHTVAAMMRTNQLEIEISSEKTRYIECFRKTDLRRTEISVIAWGCQVFSGVGFAGYVVYFFEQSGLPAAEAFKMGLGNTAGAFCGTVASWILITKFGRRPLFIFGMTWLATLHFIIGICAVLGMKGYAGAGWAQSGLMLLWVFSYDLTIGPLAYCIVGEVSSTRLRNKTVGLSRNFFNVIGIVAGVITPYQLNPLEWNWGGKAGFFWGSIAAVFAVWSYFRVPETKGRSYYELDVLFERRIPASKFKETVVEAVLQG